MAGAVANTVAHDLGNVASLVVGPAAFLSESTWDKLTRAQRSEFLGMLNYGIRLVKNRCHNFISLNREELRTPERIDALARSVVEDCAQVFGDSVRLSVDAEDGVPEVHCVRSKMERLFWNLLDNAYKVVHSKELKGVRLEIGISFDERGVHVRVGDSIPGGMPEEELRAFLDLRDRVFAFDADDPNALQVLTERMHDASMRKKQGFGMGSFFLCMTVRELRGFLEVETGPEGSSFSFTLPV